MPQAPYHLEIAIRLRRGLSILLGDVGTGKTTILRTLLQAFKDEENDYIFHMILDPSYKSEFQFLSHLVNIFDINVPFRSTLDFKESLQRYLFQKGVEENIKLIDFLKESLTRKYGKEWFLKLKGLADSKDVNT